MKTSVLKKNEKGFTIIEVLIVLAIAGLIMVIVFLAVPALQRNSRNTQRTADAARTASAVNECLGNNNGQLPKCNSLTAAELTKYVTIANNQQLVTAGSATTGSMFLETGKKCDTAGAVAVAGAPRSFTITYKIETTGADTDRCVGS